jgi:hypothetical protein
MLSKNSFGRYSGHTFGCGGLKHCPPAVNGTTRADAGSWSFIGFSISDFSLFAENFANGHVVNSTKLEQIVTVEIECGKQGV